MLQLLRARLLLFIALLTCLLGATVVQGNDSGSRFLFIASPSKSNIYYVEIPFGSTDNVTAKVLIDGQASKCSGDSCGDGSDQGLQAPNSIALHKGTESMTLYVADSGAQNIYAYEIAGGLSMKSALSFLGIGAYGEGHVLVGKQRLIVEGVEGIGGIDVDGNGNLFFAISDGQVQMVTAAALASSSASNVTTTAIYSTDKTKTVSSPVDVTADGANVYWANGAGGEIPGTVVFGPETSGTPQQLAANGNGASGVCRARGNIYYSAATASLYAIKSSGGAIAEVSSAFQQPRGCAFDGESTLYVADEAGFVYSLPAMSSLRGVRKLRQVTTVEAPTDVAVYTPNDLELVGEVLAMYSSAPRGSPCDLQLWVLSLCVLLLGMNM